MFGTAAIHFALCEPIPPKKIPFKAGIVIAQHSGRAKRGCGARGAAAGGGIQGLLSPLSSPLRQHQPARRCWLNRNTHTHVTHLPVLFEGVRARVVWRLLSVSECVWKNGDEASKVWVRDPADRYKDPPPTPFPTHTHTPPPRSTLQALMTL